MANAHDYFEYLTDHVDISPANSQEELNAATTIAELMGEHGIEVKTEEFDTASLGRLPYALLLVIIFIGTFIAGIGGLPFAFIGGLLAIGSVAVIILDHLGNNIFENFGPVARSQNVVAVHEASGPLVAKGNRPVVVVAHYDSPRESFLYSSGIAKYLPMLRRYTTLCVVIAGVSSFIQTLAFLPEALRRVFWVLGFLAAIPPLIVGIGAIVERFSSCSLGANDNKSSIAALLGVLEAVFPSDSAESLVARLAQKREAAELAARPVRHGEDVLRTLGVLPESCEIEYIDEPEPVDEEPEVEEEPAQATADLGTAEEPEAAEPAAAPAAKPAFRVVGDELPDPGATQLYRPQVADVARRAALFDLPDPSEEANDPFAPAAAPTSMADRLGHADRQNARRISDQSLLPRRTSPSASASSIARSARRSTPSMMTARGMTWSRRTALPRAAARTALAGRAVPPSARSCVNQTRMLLPTMSWSRLRSRSPSTSCSAMTSGSSRSVPTASTMRA